jgi:type I restriction enzyme M protein
LAESRSSLDVSTLEEWLWEAACAIRGPLDAPKFKDYILPLIFLKRLSDVFEDEAERLGGEFGGKEIAADLAQQDHELARFNMARGRRYWGSVTDGGAREGATEKLLGN